MISPRNMTRFIQNCSNGKTLTLIFSPGSHPDHSVGERNAVSNSQHSRREATELNLVLAEIHDNVLEASVCKALSLTGNSFVSADLHACH